MLRRRFIFPLRLAIFPFALPLAFLTGCGIGPLAPPAATPGPALSGTVFGGAQPIIGATVKIYAVGNAGNGSAATDILTGPLGTSPNAYATTDGSGAFHINSDYACPSAAPGTPIYIVAIGGNPGITPSVNNTAIALVAAYGPCNTLSSSQHIVINEATTAAAAWALAPFATSITGIGASSTNLTGITNAFLFANQLVETTTGYAPGTALPTGAITESAKLYSLANVLASCVNSNGTDTHCSGLFTDVTPAGGTKPTDTFAAALSVVQNPGNNVSNIYTNTRERSESIRWARLRTQ